MNDKSNATPPKSSLSIILATTSPFKKSLFERLGLPFTLVDPKIDETPLTGESAPELALRLAKEKAIAGRNIIQRQQDKEITAGIVIGCDQAPVTQTGDILHKPGTRDRASSQLMALRGQQTQFHTAVYTLAFGSETENAVETGLGHTDLTTVHYRKETTQATIDRYLAREEAWHCAGAIQSESLGITLLSKIETQDPTALIGLPLIGLTTLLLKMGVSLP